MGEFQRRNFALACAATEAFLGRFDRRLAAQVAATVTVPGRLELIAEHPPVYVDAAHNPAGAAALAESLPGVVGERPVVACLAILADKDAEAMIRALAPVLDRAICTELPAAALEGHGRPGASSRSARELALLCDAVRLPAEVVSDFDSALLRADGLAASEVTPGAVLVAGSHYAIAPARALVGA
jgi:dihydrofolate synthase / folylpolyglutamate synthase